MIHIRLVDLRVLQLHCVWQKTTQAAAPLDYASDSHTEHQVIGLEVVSLWLGKLFEVFQVFGIFFPGQCLAKLSSWSLIVYGLIEHIVDHSDKNEFLLSLKNIMFAGFSFVGVALE